MSSCSLHVIIAIHLDPIVLSQACLTRDILILGILRSQSQIRRASKDDLCTFCIESNILLIGQGLARVFSMQACSQCFARFRVKDLCFSV